MRISSEIFNNPIVNNVILYEETDSTNTRAKEFGNGGCVDGTLIIADRQTAGRGRMGRSFSSPSGTGIYMSLLLKPSIEVSQVSRITLIAAMAVARALGDINNISPQIKWPNDILVDGKKVVGILTEMSCDTVQLPKTFGLADIQYGAETGHETCLKYVVVGIGINVNNESFPSDLRETAGSLYLACGKRLNREQIIYDVLDYFARYYKEFLSHEDLSFMISEYNERLAGYMQHIYIIPHEKTQNEPNPYRIDTTGLTPYLCAGIDSSGGLLCRSTDGITTTVNAGEVSVRGIHGYAP